MPELSHNLRVICARIPGDELIAAECEHLAGGLPDAEGVAAAQTLEYVPRSAYLSLGLSCAAQAGSLEELARLVGQAHVRADRFRIELLRLAPWPDLSERQAIISLANALNGAPDLEHPLQRFLIVAQKDRLWFGEILARSQHSYKQHDAKPFHTTSSLPSRLARALVNLVSPPARSLIDPFCGTGSILLEACALGLQAYGMDLNPKMTGMTRRNLAAFGYNAHVEKGDALNCRQCADALVSDLPYGRILDIERSGLLAILRHASGLAPQAIYLAEEDISGLLHDAGYAQIRVLRVRKRFGMQRFIHRCRA